MKHTGMATPRTLAPRLRPSKPTSMTFEHVAGTVGDFRKEADVDRGMMAFLGLNGRSRRRAGTRKAATRKGTTPRRRPAKAKVARRLRNRR